MSEPQVQPFREMIRYGRNKKNNRNSVLLTFRAGEAVYFGISRCCDNDVFDRERGLTMARGRAQKALDQEGRCMSAMDFKRETTRGAVPVTDVPLLLEWFRGLNK